MLALAVAALGGGGAAEPAGRGPRLSLAALASWGYVDVQLDTSRFREAQVATLTILNKVAVAIEGDLPACTTVFEPGDPRFSSLVPRESSGFAVGVGQTIRLTRLFRLLEPDKRPPDGSAYRLSAQPLLHDLSRCRG